MVSLTCWRWLRRAIMSFNAVANRYNSFAYWVLKGIVMIVETPWQFHEQTPITAFVGDSFTKTRAVVGRSLKTFFIASGWRKIHTLSWWTFEEFAFVSTTNAFPSYLMVCGKHHWPHSASAVCVFAYCVYKSDGAIDWSLSKLHSVRLFPKTHSILPCSVLSLCFDKYKNTLKMYCKPNKIF